MSETKVIEMKPETDEQTKLTPSQALANLGACARMVRVTAAEHELIARSFDLIAKCIGYDPAQLVQTKVL